MDDPIDEFSFLAEQASDAGIAGPLPHGERVTLTLDDGRTISALRWGDATPQVTLLHGAGLNAHTWDTTVLALGLPALAIDLPGHGDSSWRDDAAYVARVLAPDVAAAMDAWTTGPQLLVGQSLGGLTATAVAASRPDLVRELVVVDITPGISQSGGASQLLRFYAGAADWASRDELTAHALSFGLGGSPKAAARGVFFNSRVREDGRVEWKHHFARLMHAASASPEAAAEAGARQSAMAAVLGESGWEDLATVTAPLTLVRGTRGYVSEDDRAVFAERVPGATILDVEAGHNVQEELPVDLGALLRARAAQ